MPTVIPSGQAWVVMARCPATAAATASLARENATKDSSSASIYLMPTVLVEGCAEESSAFGKYLNILLA